MDRLNDTRLNLLLEVSADSLGDPGARTLHLSQKQYLKYRTAFISQSYDREDLLMRLTSRIWRTTSQRTSRSKTLEVQVEAEVDFEIEA